MKIYLDDDYKCHVNSGEDLMEYETDAFKDKCKQYIEGYRVVPMDVEWTRSDGVKFIGEMIAPWRDSNLLEELQALYDEEQAKQADMVEALSLLSVDAI